MTMLRILVVIMDALALTAFALFLVMIVSDIAGLVREYKRLKEIERNLPEWKRCARERGCMAYPFFCEFCDKYKEPKTGGQNE